MKNIQSYNEFLNESVITDTPLLRKLAPKSILSFGQYKGLAVQDVIKTGHPAYLRFLYYNIEGISFIDDILREIGVVGDYYDYQIKKPGTNSELGKKVDEIKIKHMDVGDRAHAKKVAKNRQKQKNVTSMFADKKIFSKGSMQARNQGR